MDFSGFSFIKTLYIYHKNSFMILRQVQHKFIQLFLFLFFVAPGFIFSQSFNYTTFSVENGLSQSEITCMKEDSRGYLWIGTKGGGVNQFNGVKFSIFEEKNGLGGNIVSAVDEDVDGNMWIGSTWGGVSKFDGKKFVNYTIENGLLADGIVAICRGKGRKMLVATNNGINIIEGKTISALKNDEFSDKVIQSMYRDNHGNIWIITNKSLFLYNGYSLININQLFKFKFNVSAITQDKHGNIWLAAREKGLYILSKTTGDSYNLTPYTRNNELNKLQIQALLFDKYNHLWLCTNGSGVVKYDYINSYFLNKSTSFPSNSVTSVCEDHFGNIWFGTSANLGLIKYSPSAFTYFDFLEGFNSEQVYGIACDNKNNVFAGTYGKGLYVYNGKELKKYTTGNGLSSNFIRTILWGKNNTLWIGTNEGLNYYKDGVLHKFELPHTSIAIRSLMEDRAGNLWIGTYGAGLIKYDGVNFKIFNVKNGLTHNYIHSLLEDSKGNIWIGTGAGVNKYSNNEFHSYGLGSGFCNSYIGNIIEDKMGNVWFGTDRCIVRYNGKEFKSYNEDDGLTSTTIYLMSTDNKGNIWVGTNKGLDKISLNNNGDIHAIANYGTYEGFKGLECNTRAVAKDSLGNMYFGTIKGVIEYKPRQDKEFEAKSSLHVTDVKLYAQETKWEDYGAELSPWFKLPVNLALPHNKNSLTFEFIGINLYSPQKVKYLYRLKGLDKRWNSSTSHLATYTNLNPGNYVFELKSYSDNKNNAQYTHYKFSVEQPFWRSWWFISILLSGLTVGIYFIYKIRERHIHFLNIKLERQVQLRTIEIVKQKKEIETLFKEIHHRVKNNLQVINSLINLQSSFIEDEKTLAIFNECQNRIYTMALLHEKLYATQALTKLELEPYIIKLTEHLHSAYVLDTTVRFDIQVNVRKIGLDTIISLGLLINEIVSNSLKYAFTDKQQKDNVIRIHIESLNDKRHRMFIGDNGIGCKVNINEDQNTFGLELIKILVEQLNGSIERLNEPGTVFKIEFESIDKALNKAP